MIIIININITLRRIQVCHYEHRTSYESNQKNSISNSHRNKRKVIIITAPPQQVITLDDDDANDDTDDER